MARQLVEPINAIDLNDPAGSETYEELTPLLSGVISGAIDPTAMLRRREEQFPQNAAAAICDLACGQGVTM